MKRFVASLTLSSILLSTIGSPLVALAQSQQDINAAASSQVRQTFNPSARIQGGRTIKGIQFSGVGGAIAGCLDAGGAIVKGISDLFPTKEAGSLAKKVSGFNFATSGTSQSVPVSSPKGSNDNFQKIQEQLTKADKREACLNGVAYAVAKGLLQQVTNKVLNWANNGFGGDPLYVPNMESFLKRQSDKQVRQFLSDIPRRDPIFGNAIRSAITYSVSGVRDGLLDVTMDTIAAKRYEEFQNDFSQGGWQSFLDPNNNPIGAFFDATDELGQSIADEEQNTREELQRNDGFLDMKFCVKYAEEIDTIDPLYCEDLTTDDSYDSCVTRSQVAAQEANGPDCLEWESVTPGSVIASQVSEVTGSTIRQLEQADEINEVLGAFFDQALSNLISKGLASLGDKRNKSFRSVGMSYASVNGSGSGRSSSDGIDALGYQEADGSARVVDFDVSRPQQVRAILQAQYDYLNRMLDARKTLVRIVPTLGALDYCIPGPNPTWRDNLDDNAETYFGSIQEVQKDSSLFSRVLQSIPLIGGLFSGNKSHTIAAADVALFDKVSNGPVAISDTVYHEGNHTTPAIFGDVQKRYDEVLAYYEANYTPTTITNAFVAVDTVNALYAAGFVADALTETANLPAYAAGTAQLDEYYVGAEIDTRNTIRELQAIHDEVNAIVAAAKARYISERAASGNPVVLSCINQAYKVDASPITPVARQESDAVSPFYNTFLEASQFFYTQL